eukprot:s1902_g7.t1
MLLRRTQKLSTPMQELFAFEERGDEVGLVDFVKVAQLFNSLADVEARLLFLEAMAADLNLKLSHVRMELLPSAGEGVKVSSSAYGSQLWGWAFNVVSVECAAFQDHPNVLARSCRYLSELDPVLRGEVVDRLLPAVPEINTLGGFDLAVNSVHQKASLCRDRAAIVNLLLFNPACADGRYEFDVTEPAHRKMLDDLIIVNHWERDRAKRLGRPDLSKHGDHECIRNCSVNGNYRIWRSADVQLPPRAEIKFDYCSPFHPQRGTPSTPDRTVRLLRQALTTMDFNQSLKVKVLRSVAHRLVLTPEQCGWLLEALPATALELDTEIRDSPRVEAFVVLYARCNDIAELLSDEECGLYSLVHLTREEVLTVRKRLGRTRTWDIARADVRTQHVVPCVIEFIIPPPEDPTDMNPAGRMVLMTRRASNAGPAAPGLPTTKPKSRTERMAEASIDEERMRPILKDPRHAALNVPQFVQLDYNMLDNPVSLGHANRYMMDLTLHEDWHCAQRKENIDAPFWSEKAHLADKGSKWLVPDEWSKEMPKVGIFGMTFLQGFNDPDLELRLRLAKEWLGWNLPVRAKERWRPQATRPVIRVQSDVTVSILDPEIFPIHPVRGVAGLNLSWPVAELRVTNVPEVPETTITRLSCGVNLQGDQVCICEDGWYGPQCDQLCNCTGAGIAGCNEGPEGDGSCYCKPGYVGETCDRCGEYYYNLQNGCAIYCHPDDRCSGNGECTTDPVTHLINGCACYESWDGEDCRQCAQNYYPSRVCNVYCDKNTTCSGHGECSDFGTCVCDAGRRGTNCDQCEQDEGFMGLKN